MYQRPINFKDTVKAKKFFISHFSEYKDKIKSIEQVNFGFSNKTFLLKTEDNKDFKVRLADNNKHISRTNEQEIIKLMPDQNLLFYDPSTGDSIYKWIKGDILLNSRILSDDKCTHDDQRTHNDEFLIEDIHATNPHQQKNTYKATRNSNTKIPLKQEHMIKIYNLAKSFHDVKLPKSSNVLVHDDFDYFEISKPHISKKYQDIYIELVNKHKDLPKVLCHNDISEKNIICDENNELHLIDYEWGRLNSVYWDLGNWIRNSELNRSEIYDLSKIASLSYDTLLDFAFIAIYYALQLIHSLEKLKVKEEYLIKTFNNLDLYLSWKKDNSFSNTALIKNTDLQTKPQTNKDKPKKQDLQAKNN